MEKVCFTAIAGTRTTFHMILLSLHLVEGSLFNVCFLMMTSQVCHLSQNRSYAKTRPRFLLKIFSRSSMCVALGVLPGARWSNSDAERDESQISTRP